MYPTSTHDNNRVASWRDHVSRHLRTCIAITTLMLCSSTLFAQLCQPPSLTFKDPTRIAGLDKRVGAIYKFSNVTTGVDCHIEIMYLHKGATLYNMDVPQLTMGYEDAWQPYVNAVKGDTTWLDWKITFKKGGTSIDTAFPCLSITAVDIDGDDVSLREFIVASTPGAYAVHPNTALTVTFDGVNSRAEGPKDVVDNIDTSQKRFMFQMNFTNVSTIYYRNGSLNKTTNGTMQRHTCIYFKSFFESGLITLPMQLLSFTGKTAAEGVTLNWSVADEKDLKTYNIQRSRDGAKWEDVSSVDVKEGTKNYSFTDKSGSSSSRVYYRLLQIGQNGSVGFSHVVILSQNAQPLVVNMPTIVSKQVPIQLETNAPQNFRFSLFNSTGVNLGQKVLAAQPGINTLRFDLPNLTAAGVYLIAVQNADGVVVERKRIVVQ